MLEPLLRIPRRGEEPPGQLAGVGVKGGDEATYAEIGAAVADDHLALHHPRRAGDGVVGLAVGGVGLPDLAAAGVEGEQTAVQRADEHLALPEGHAAIDRLAAAHPQPVGRDLWIEHPQFASRPAIEGVDDAIGGADVEHPIDHERRRLDAAARIAQRGLPGQSQPRQRFGVNLAKGREPLFVVGPPRRQPVVAVPAGRRDAGAVHRAGSMGPQQERGRQQDHGGDHGQGQDPIDLLRRIHPASAAARRVRWRRWRPPPPGG